MIGNLSCVDPSTLGPILDNLRNCRHPGWPDDAHEIWAILMEWVTTNPGMEGAGGAPQRLTSKGEVVGPEDLAAARPWHCLTLPETWFLKPMERLMNGRTAGHHNHWPSFSLLEWQSYTGGTFERLLVWKAAFAVEELSVGRSMFGGQISLWAPCPLWINLMSLAEAND